MDFTNSLDWTKVYEGVFEAEMLPLYPKQHKPLSDIVLPLVFDATSTTLAIEVYSLTAKPTWKLGAIIRPFVTINGLFNLAIGYYKTQLNQATLVSVNNITTDYKVRISIPKWIYDIRIAVWIYKGELPSGSLQAKLNNPNTTIFLFII